MPPAPQILAAFSEDSDRAFEKLMRDRACVFWVKWSEDDAKIVALCEAVLKTGKLTATRTSTPQPTEEDENATLETLTIAHGEKSVTITLTGDPADRHTTLVALNELLAPDHEIRFLWDSTGADAGAFLPLSAQDWREVEASASERYPFRVLPITPTPNLFTELTPRMKPVRTSGLEARPGQKPWWQFWG